MVAKLSPEARAAALAELSLWSEPSRREMLRSCSKLLLLCENSLPVNPLHIEFDSSVRNNPRSEKPRQLFPFSEG